MIKNQRFHALLILLISPIFVISQANFIAPDTVSVNQPVVIINNSGPTFTNYWNFSEIDVNAAVSFTSLGNPGNLLNVPCFSDIIYDGTNYYLFNTNYGSSIVRWNFGASPLNTPALTNLGNVGNVLPPQLEGIQIFMEEDSWYAYVAGG